MATPHRWAARAFVIALHAALLVAALLHRPPGLAPARERQATSVRLIAPPRQQAPLPDPNRFAARRPSTAQAPSLSIAPTRDDTEIAAPTSPATPAPPAPTAVPPAEPPRITLKLTLPPGYAASSATARNPALNDPRSNTARTTLEDRIADATGGAGAWVEEHTSDNRNQAVGALGEHRRVMRRGNTCVEIFRSRIADSDPFNGNVAPIATPMAGRPYKCK
ncbi:hypothetical protein NYO99_17180 [Pelomonas sp. UHG3]|uniref:Uncharacterized protein n=1 Tax=Roseateles hydrophilus TaxID=2975054 RepID=A0ACC6CE69_9BURK|nr:hypothetical protein [Pelomonas sp. UHG3]MCY4746713.1 hypothetical protein [Pelomonas sp. UHG3]